MSSSNKVKVACVQIEPKLFDKEGNLSKITGYVDEAVTRGAKLVVFPECSLQGYMFESWTEASEYSEPIPGPATDVLAEKAKEHKVYIIMGMVEREGDNLYNSSVLVGPHGERGGVVGNYRKIHPWWPPEHNWVTDGNLGFKVFPTDIGKIGMMICYDAWFPEPSRCLALNGADIICHPSNWCGVEGFTGPDFLTKTRALENHVYFIGCDRIGTERDVPFCGRSQILEPSGKVIVEASLDKEEIIYADIDVLASRSKCLVEGEARSDLWWARRPENYRVISD